MNTICPVDYLLAKYEAQQVEQAQESERKRQRIEREKRELRASLGDFVEALREATWGNELEMTRLHIAHVNRDTAELGRLMYALIEKELELAAERITEEY